MHSWTFIVWLCFSWLAVKGDQAASKLGRSDRDRDLAPLDAQANGLNIFNGAGSSKKGRTPKGKRPSTSKGKGPVPTPQPTPAPTPFSGILTLQAQAGVCPGTVTEGIGCNINPNAMLNCYDVRSIGGTAPFVIDRVRFWIASSVAGAAPADLSVIVYSSASGAPSTLIGSEALTGFVLGVNTFSLTTPITVNTPQFCIGVSTQDTNLGVGLYVQIEAGTGTQSFLQSCFGTPGYPSFRALQMFDEFFTSDYCIEAFVRSP